MKNVRNDAFKKKSFQIFRIPDPESGYGLYIFRILKIFWTVLWYGSFVVKYFLVIYYTTDFRAIGPKVLCEAEQIYNPLKNPNIIQGPLRVQSMVLIAEFI